MAGYQFLDGKETFTMEYPENYSYLYFPIAGEHGIKGSITPNLGGDIKLDQNTFLLEPVSAENLHNNRSTRNFWCYIEGKGSWSVTGVSAEEESLKFTSQQDTSKITAGFMWQTLDRSSQKYQLRAEVTSFVPVERDVEIMYVKIVNNSEEPVTFTPTAAIPIYGRSADNIRDHRHVTSLLHRIQTTEYGVMVKPTLSFDERGHQINNTTYFVCGLTGDGKKPKDFYPIVEDYIGEGGSFTNPQSIRNQQTGIASNMFLEGKEAMGGLRFEQTTIQAGESETFIIFLGATKNQDGIADVLTAYSSKEKVEEALACTIRYWQDKVNVSFHTGDNHFDQYMAWVSFQPILRRIYGCSFLPHHDYGKGGRGWRDLWQDCLALLIMNPNGVRQMLLDNFGGIRIDGTNATIIGEKQGEFIADRNNITRVWMDHGVWPFLTTRLYIDQTGDIEILNQQVPYFKDCQSMRGCGRDTKWDDNYGKRQKDMDGNISYGSVFEHLLLQHLCAFFEVGEHNHILLRGADWNDALDMANERGESVAFTNAYAGNLCELADYLLLYRVRTGCSQIELAEEVQILLADDKELYENVCAKQKLLANYMESCRHNLSGNKKLVSVEELTQSLKNKASWIMEHIRKTEWVMDQEHNGWFNGYYDNHGLQVEGEYTSGIRMMLTSQVFAIMSGTATSEQIKAITKSADKYLYNEQIGGYRLNTDFHDLKTDLGRMFGFAYGEKENGAVFSHMAVMYANALYKRGFVAEGHKALQALADAAMNFETSKIYPGIPEYFNANGRGMYHYLTGAASWYMLTMITEVFGVYGLVGDLCIQPKLMCNQFDENGEAGLSLYFAGKRLHITICNPKKKEYGRYRISEVTVDGVHIPVTHEDKVVMKKEILDKWNEHMHEIVLKVE